MLARDPLIKRITAVLAKLESYLKLLSAQNLNDGAVLFEDTCVPLLNCVYSLALKNANAEAANFPAADLIARDARRAFQITINDTTAKIRSTHDKATEHNLAAVVDKLTIFFVVAKAPAEPGENSKFTRCTSPDIDTLDLTGLITHIRSLELDHISKIADILDREISPKIPEEKRAIPAICNLPFESIGDLFVGRDKFQADLHASVATSGTTVIRSKQIIHGMGGVGKTRAAVEYGWKHGSEYSALLFITADSPENLRTNLAALCGKNVLNLPEQAATDLDTQIAAATHWLKNNEGWFLILDNVDTEDARDAVRQFTAQIPQGHILITTRLADWPAGFTALDLDVLDEKASIRLLLDHTADRRIPKPEDPTVAAQIAHHLDGLALALEQAAAWVRRDRRTLADYLAAWEKMNIHLHQTQLTNWVADYPRSLHTTYHTSTTLLTPEARQLFAILGWLAPDPIPMSAIEHLKTLEAPRTAAIELTDLHLARLTPDGTSITIHRMLQAIEKAEQKDEKPTALLAALEWINEEMPTDTFDVRTWPIAVPLIPHAIAAANAGADRDIPDPSGRLLNQCAILLATRADHRGAEPLFRKTIAIAEDSRGETHPEVAIRLNNLAQLLHATNRLVEAEPLMRSALEIDEASYGDSHPNVARGLNNLAGLLQAMNRLAEAEPLMRRALAIDESRFGESHRNVASRLNNLAQLLQATNRLAEAEPLMRRALAIFKANYGDSHPDVANLLNNLAGLMYSTNRLVEAEPLMRRALDILEASYGESHPNVAISLNNLAQLLQDTDRLAEAEPLMRRALDIWKASYGEFHPNVASSLNNLAQLLRATNRLAEAEPLLRRALAINEASYGDSHPNVAIQLNNLARLLQASSRLVEAEPLMRRMVKIFLNFTRDTGHKHPHLMAAINNYVGLLMAIGDTEEQAVEKINAIMKPYGMSV